MIRAARIAIQSLRVAVATYWYGVTPSWAPDDVAVRRALHAHTQETRLNLMKKGLL